MADDQKRALLAAVAQQGTAGADAYKQYADSVQAQRQAAVAAAQQRASVIGAGPAATQALTGDAVATSDPYAQDAATGATAYANENARLAQANSNYMDQAAASGGAYAAKAAASRAKKAGSNNPFASLINALGGEASAKAQLPAILAQASLDAKHSDMTKTGMFGLPHAFQKGDITPAAQKATMNAVEQQAGIPLGTLSRFLGKESPDYEAPQSVVEKRQAGVADIKRDPTYQSVYKNAQSQINAYASQKDKKGKHVMTRTEAKTQVISDLRTDPRYSSGERQAIYDQIVKDLR